jgi:hypothetical protein
LIGAFVAVQNNDAAPASECHASARAVLSKTNSNPIGGGPRRRLVRSGKRPAALAKKIVALSKNDQFPRNCRRIFFRKRRKWSILAKATIKKILDSSPA